jgi:hypothetical protein
MAKKDGEEERSLHLIGQRQNEGNVRALLNPWGELKVHLILLRKEKEMEGRGSAPRPFLSISAAEEFRSLLL